MFTDILSFLGDNAVLVIVACIEIIVGIILIIQVSKTQKDSKSSFTMNEKSFLSMKDESAQASLWIRVKDHMPVFYIGNLEAVLMVNYDSLTKDITRIFQNLKDHELSRKLWKEYLQWDGISHFSYEVELQNERFVQLIFRRSRDSKFDLLEATDVSEEHQQITQYQNQLAKAEEESQSKTTFLSRMSHEIRTPMNGIIGMLSLAEKKIAKDNPIYTYLIKSEELSNHLLALINDILDMSRIEAGKVELEMKEFSIHRMGDKLYSMFKTQLQEKGVAYEVRYEDITDDVVIGDELRVSQVLINFISNAVKFTSQGEVIVTIKQMMSSKKQADLMLKVHDTGIGMSTDFISKIFRPFEQESIDTGKKYGGTGLGMAISDQIVRLMGGQIVVESTKGIGSDFSVFVSFQVPEKATVYQNAESPVENNVNEESHTFKNRRVLLAEDNEINVFVIQEMLESAGASVEVAEDGKQAVALFESHPEGYFDCILMDVQMPVMDGRTAARTIRHLDRKDAKEIYIFALSADAFTEDVRLSKEYGMNGHFAKPIDFDFLQNEVCRMLDQKEGN